MDRRPLLLLAGGGTGGHIFPNLAVLERVRERIGDDAFDVRVLVSHRAVDKEAALAGELVKEEEVVAIPASPWSARPGGAARFARDWVRGRRAVRGLLHRYGTLRSHPGGSLAQHRRDSAVRVVCVATGGFVSGPGVAGARREGAATALVNLDAVPGRAARVLARRVDRVFQVGSQIGMPLRQSVLRETPPEQARAMLGLAPALNTLLITAGSQGARTVNAAVGELLSQAKQDASAPPPEQRASASAWDGVGQGWQLLHLCGRHEGDEAMLRAAYGKAGVRAVVKPFLNDMGLAWSAADLCISRAGAGAVGEVWARGVPTLFLPYPFHKDDHQRLNALPLVDAGGAILLKDHADARRTADALRPPLTELMHDDAKRAAMAERLRATWPGDGADVVAAWVVDMFSR